MFIRYGEIYGNFGGCRFVVLLKCIGLNWRQFSAIIIAGLLQHTVLNIQHRDVWKCSLSFHPFTDSPLKYVYNYFSVKIRLSEVKKQHGTKDL